jgi:hypothetical protein
MPQIFFPRSIEGEIAARQAARERRRTHTLNRQGSFSPSQLTGGGTYLLTESPVKRTPSLPSHTSFDGPSPMSMQGKVWLDDHNRDSQAFKIPTPPMQPNWRHDHGDMEMATGARLGILSEDNMSKHNERMGVNHLVYQFTSPIGEYPMDVSAA